MGLFSGNNKNNCDDKIYGITLLKGYEIEALEYQHRTKGSRMLADELHGLRHMADIDQLWLVGQKSENWHGWLIAKINTKTPETAKKMFCQGNYQQVLPLSYTEVIDEWYHKCGSWSARK